jgi:hypothetical protein
MTIKEEIEAAIEESDNDKVSQYDTDSIDRLLSEAGFRYPVNGYFDEV